MLWRKKFAKIDKRLRRPLHVSFVARRCQCICFNSKGISTGVVYLAYLYPLPANNLSFVSKKFYSLCLKIFRSGHVLQENGLFTQTILAFGIETPISHRTPGPWNVWENNWEENGVGSCLRKSIPSTEIRQHGICYDVFHRRSFYPTFWKLMNEVSNCNTQKNLSYCIKWQFYLQ